MAELKTRPNDRSVSEFVASIEDPKRRRDVREAMKIMRRVTGESPRMWGDAIIGYGRYRYRYESGREGEWFLCGLSPRKRNLTLYIMSGFSGFDELRTRLGKHKTGKSCLYLSRLEDVDRGALEELVRESVARVRARNPT